MRTVIIVAGSLQCPPARRSHPGRHHQAAGRCSSPSGGDGGPGAPAGGHRVGRVHRTARGRRPGGDPSPGLRLHQTRHLHRRARGEEGRGPVRDRSAPLSGGAGPGGGGAGEARSAAALAKSEVQRAVKLVDVQAISREEFDSRTSAEVTGWRPGPRRGGRGRDRPAQSGVDQGPLSDCRAGEQCAGDRGQSGAGWAAGGPGAHHRRLGRFHVSLLRQRRADLSPVCRPGQERGRDQLADRAAAGLSRPGERVRLSARGPPRLRGQPGRSRDRDDPDPGRLLQPRPGPDAGPVRPGQAGGHRERHRDAGPRRRHRHRPGSQVRAGGGTGRYAGLSARRARPADRRPSHRQLRRRARGARRGEWPDAGPPRHESDSEGRGDGA